jgi:hypothetical protein
MDLTEKNSKKLKKYSCIICDFNTSNKTGFSRHLTTRKHLNNEGVNKNVNLKNTTEIEVIKFKCKGCNKEYESRVGLWLHNKKCLQTHDFLKYESNLIDEPIQEINKQPIPEKEAVNEIVLELVKQNQEFKNLLMEQNTKIIELSSKSTSIVNTTTNNNNNNFNLNLFLNEKCKDAMNIMDFVNDLQIGFNDLENVGELGYVEGISRIFLNGLRQLDVYRRPIHCTDMKRETLYVRDNDEWNKDTADKSKIKKAICKVAFKNMLKIPEWNREHPEAAILDSPTYVEHMKIMMESIGGLGKSSDIETNKSHDKIIKNIVKNVFVDKNILLT